MKLLGLQLELKKAPPRLSVEDVATMSLACQERLDQVEAKLDEIRRGLAATQRKVYRDKEGQDGELNGQTAPLNTPPVQQYRTGDPVNW